MRGIGYERKLAEMFELWLVSRIFNVDPLPDGQCGLWSLSWEAANVNEPQENLIQEELDRQIHLQEGGSQESSFS